MIFLEFRIFCLTNILRSFSEENFFILSFLEISLDQLKTNELNKMYLSRITATAKNVKILSSLSD
jgi:hypothetical protein